MDYLLFTYRDSDTTGGLSEEEQYALEAACQDNDLALRESGYLRLVVTLQGTDAVSLHHGVLSANPSMSQPTGIYLIQAKDMNDAIRTATRMPQARLGPIEIRAVERVISG